MFVWFDNSTREYSQYTMYITTLGKIINQKNMTSMSAPANLLLPQLGKPPNNTRPHTALEMPIARILGNQLLLLEQGTTHNWNAVELPLSSTTPQLRDATTYMHALLSTVHGTTQRTAPELLGFLYLPCNITIAVYPRYHGTIPYSSHSSLASSNYPTT